MASLMSRGIPIITSTRTGSGTTLTDNSSVAIGSGSLNAQKAKILLQLAIGEFGSDMSKIEEVFEQA